MPGTLFRGGVQMLGAPRINGHTAAAAVQLPRGKARHRSWCSCTGKEEIRELVSMTSSPADRAASKVYVMQLTQPRWVADTSVLRTSELWSSCATVPSMTTAPALPSVYPIILSMRFKDFVGE